MAILGATGSNCLEATQIRLEIKTDICDLERVVVYLGGASRTAPIAQVDLMPKPCGADQQRRVGSLVLVPTDRGKTFVVIVEGTTRLGDCAVPKGCVSASRSVAFLSHSSLELPVNLERSCLDRVCKPGETCVQGACVPEDVDCRTMKTCVPAADASADASLTEAGLEAGLDSALDAGGCPIVLATILASSSATHHWSFDELNGPAMDPVGMTSAPLANGYSRLSSSPGCGNALVSPSTMGTMPMATTAQPAIAMRLRPAGFGTATLLTGAMNQAMWTLGIDAGLHLTFTSTKGVMMPGSPVVSAGVLKSNKWNDIEVVASGMTGNVQFAINGSVEFPKLVSAGVPGALSLTIGPMPIVSNDIDELWTYSVP